MFLKRRTSNLVQDISIIDSQNLVKNNPCEAPENSPASWCKKSESKGAVVPPADFLLEAEKRGSPPKSEKAAAFWRVGGAGRGVQPFLRKENKINEENGDDFAESSPNSVDSTILSQGGLPRRFCESARNDDSFLNLALFAESSKISPKYAIKG